jgi:hypothetical protein
MKNYFKFILVLIIGHSSVLQAESAMVERFLYYLDPLQAILEDAYDAEDDDKALRLIAKGPARIQLFGLQALFKAYKDQSGDNFDRMRRTARRMENAIGEFDKWTKIIKKEPHNVSANVKKRNRKKLAEAREDLLNVFDKGPEVLDNMHSFILNYDFGSYKEDKEFLMYNLSKHIKKNLIKKPYKLYLLEDDDPETGQGNGLHEFRREVRWFNMQAAALNGLVHFKPKYDCSMDEYAYLVDTKLANDKYAKLRKGIKEKNPCLISQCVYLRMVEIIAQVGDLKDNIEVYLNNKNTDHNDEVPKKYLPEINAIKKEVDESGIFHALRDELKECRE